MAVGLPSAARDAYRSLPVLALAYEQVVAPLVAQSLSDPLERARVDGSLRVMSVKFGLAMLSYARLTGHRLQPDVAVLAGAVTRLYDDLIDGDGAGAGDRAGAGDGNGTRDPAADDRLGDLMGNRAFVPGTPAELLLGRLVHGIERTLAHPPHESVFMALVSLHEYQVLSRRQREPDVPLDVLEKITRGKGAAAHLILCGLVKPRLEPAERELVMDLGEILQSLDDYMDVEFDRGNGVTTLVSCGALTLPGIARRLRAARPRLAAVHGGRGARPYCGMLYFLLLQAWVSRRLPVLGRLARRPARRSAVLAFLSRGEDALPPAAPGPSSPGPPS
ncbi:class 1 isoprenoid biosynthesis enzyme [Streptomyces cupreus]|uniref:Class 1 isoprenoid biosynthesis enzyme n=1 Tax=Streptomyces cupreus TaxID=2759956 RepID=A0A7X1MCQ6_9ACTN|nr:class 1 isoprenoid biosynthesis enzyme [Streptomyces cupreus]MBC2906143.1 class 1 isoprenoid biosynthesis enzyme [Streptomyces cupreus]